MHRAGEYKDTLQASYTAEVGAVKEEARAEVAAVHQQAEHFAAYVIEGAEMYTSGVRADAQRKIDSERQAVVERLRYTYKRKLRRLLPKLNEL